MNDKSMPDASQPDPAGSPGGAVPPPDVRAERIDWLFRDALRRHQLHPLMALLRRHRGVDAP